MLTTVPRHLQEHSVQVSSSGSVHRAAAERRVATHPVRDVHQLTPCAWKERFANDPMWSIADER